MHFTASGPGPRLHSPGGARPIWDNGTISWTDGAFRWHGDGALWNVEPVQPEIREPATWTPDAGWSAPFSLPEGALHARYFTLAGDFAAWESGGCLYRIRAGQAPQALGWGAWPVWVHPRGTVLTETHIAPRDGHLFALEVPIQPPIFWGDAGDTLLAVGIDGAVKLDHRGRLLRHWPGRVPCGSEAVFQEATGTVVHDKTELETVFRGGFPALRGDTLAGPGGRVWALGAEDVRPLSVEIDRHVAALPEGWLTCDALGRARYLDSQGALMGLAQLPLACGDAVERMWSRGAKVFFRTTGGDVYEGGDGRFGPARGTPKPSTPAFPSGILPVPGGVSVDGEVIPVEAVGAYRAANSVFLWTAQGLLVEIPEATR